MDFQTYIKPELLVVVPVLYIIGMILKNTHKVSDNYIPAILGGVGIVLCCCYVFGLHGLSVSGAFTAITQGILVAGAAVYANQLYKQVKDKDEY